MHVIFKGDYHEGTWFFYFMASQIKARQVDTDLNPKLCWPYARESQNDLNSEWHFCQTVLSCWQYVDT